MVLKPEQSINQMSTLSLVFDKTFVKKCRRLGVFVNTGSTLCSKNCKYVKQI